MVSINKFSLSLIIGSLLMACSSDIPTPHEQKLYMTGGDGDNECYSIKFNKHRRKQQCYDKEGKIIKGRFREPMSDDEIESAIEHKKIDDFMDAFGNSNMYYSPYLYSPTY